MEVCSRLFHDYCYTAAVSDHYDFVRDLKDGKIGGTLREMLERYAETAVIVAIPQFPCRTSSPLTGTGPIGLLKTNVPRCDEMRKAVSRVRSEYEFEGERAEGELYQHHEESGEAKTLS